MIGYPPLWIVIGADSLGTIATTHQVAARIRNFLSRSGFLRAVEFCLQQRHRLGAVLVLGALVLTLHHDAGGNMGQAHGGVGFVDVLAACTGSAIGIDAQIGLADFNRVPLIRFRHHRHRTGRRVDAPLGLGFRHTLHAVCTGFEFQFGIHLFTGHTRNDFFIAAVLARIFADNLYTPALFFGVAGIHAE